MISALPGLSLTDAVQVATALETGCDALLTNDHTFTKMEGEIPILVLDDIEA